MELKITLRLEDFQEGADGFLVGESLMVSNNIKKQTVELIKK